MEVSMVQQKKKSKIPFLMKTMKAKYVEDTMKKGRFCFNHPSVFNKWESNDSAQFDRWDGFSSIIARDIMYFPIIDENENGIIYDKGKKLSDKALFHMQSGLAKHTPICCFRIIEDEEVSIDYEAKTFSYSLGENADRIIKEFGHDSYIIIQTIPFLKRLINHYGIYKGAVTYKDVIRIGEICTDEQHQELVEQLFRKDKRFEWQKEYRIALTPPTEKNPVFVEIGSIEDIAISGRIADLRN